MCSWLYQVLSQIVYFRKNHAYKYYILKHFILTCKHNEETRLIIWRREAAIRSHPALFVAWYSVEFHCNTLGVWSMVTGVRLTWGQFLNLLAVCGHLLTYLLLGLLFWNTGIPLHGRIDVMFVKHLANAEWYSRNGNRV